MILARHSTTRHTDFICIPFCACCICLYLANAPFLSTLEILRAGCINALQCFKAFSYFFDVFYLIRFFFWRSFFVFQRRRKKKGSSVVTWVHKGVPRTNLPLSQSRGLLFFGAFSKLNRRHEERCSDISPNETLRIFFFCFLKMVEKCDYSREWRFYFFFF